MKRVFSAKVLRGNRNPKHWHRGFSRQHSVQVCGPTCACNKAYQATCPREFRITVEFIGHSVGRDHTGLMRQAELIEYLNGMAHDLPVGLRAHDNAKAKGYVETVCGRRRYLRDINSGNGTIRSAAERNAINMPIQGTAADMIKIAMVRIQKSMTEAKLKSRMLLQVHDELVFDMEPSEEAQLRALVTEGMVGALELACPIEIEIGVGDNWLEAH